MLFDRYWTRQISDVDHIVYSAPRSSPNGLAFSRKDAERASLRPKIWKGWIPRRSLSAVVVENLIVPEMHIQISTITTYIYLFFSNKTSITGILNMKYIQVQVVNYNIQFRTSLAGAFHIPQTFPRSNTFRVYAQYLALTVAHRNAPMHSTCTLLTHTHGAQHTHIDPVHWIGNTTMCIFVEKYYARN